MKTLILNQTKINKIESRTIRIKSLISDALLFIKLSYLTAVLVLTCVAIIEIKHTYNIDIFPGLDTPFDNVYYQTVLPSVIN